VKTHFKTLASKKYDPEELRRQGNFLNTLLKFRNEPCKLVQVIEIVAAIKGMAPTHIANVAYANTLRLFKTSKRRAKTKSLVVIG
jgi:Tat protein secretion system quality control protein TatD with DNase activity